MQNCHCRAKVIHLYYIIPVCDHVIHGMLSSCVSVIAIEFTV